MQKTYTAFVGLSGGVDSSVTALRLVREGYRVVGVFIRTWRPNFVRCNEDAERLDAMRVAAALDIPFLTCDAVESYRRGVAEYMIEEYRRGRTPNPDVMCNAVVKFGTFLSFARKHGADFIATGHHARIMQTNGAYALARGVDVEKDQSYFLWTLKKEQLSYIQFPIGNSQKRDVRREAAAAKLPTHDKPDSQGICFLGAIDIKEFLSHYIETKPGSVVGADGNVLGTHDGVLYYTIGQRHGFTINRTSSATKPHYVTAKDIPHNRLIVSTERPKLRLRDTITLTNVNQIEPAWSRRSYCGQTRYRQKPFAVDVASIEKGRAELSVAKQTALPSSGQSCVLYDDDICLGGGIIE